MGFTAVAATVGVDLHAREGHLRSTSALCARLLCIGLEGDLPVRELARASSVH